jgi:hypothetical protein
LLRHIVPDLDAIGTHRENFRPQPLSVEDIATVARERIAALETLLFFVAEALPNMRA